MFNYGIGQSHNRTRFFSYHSLPGKNLNFLQLRHNSVWLVTRRYTSNLGFPRKVPIRSSGGGLDREFSARRDVSLGPEKL